MKGALGTTWTQGTLKQSLIRQMQSSRAWTKTWAKRFWKFPRHNLEILKKLIVLSHTSKEWSRLRMRRQYHSSWRKRSTIRMDWSSIGCGRGSMICQSSDFNSRARTKILTSRLSNIKLMRTSNLGGCLLRISRKLTIQTLVVKKWRSKGRGKSQTLPHWIDCTINRCRLRMLRI
jgi:hypothetical protein